MPYIPIDSNRKTWNIGTTFIGKIAKPGCKPIIQGNGRTSLRFTVRIPCGIPFDIIPNKRPDTHFNVRCIWFDPDFLVDTSDTVEVSGTLTWVGKDLGLLVNRCSILAKFISVKKLREPVKSSR